MSDTPSHETPNTNKQENSSPPKGGRSWLIFLPLLIIIGLAAVLFLQLGQDKETINSPLVNKALPEFTARPIEGLANPMKSLNGFTHELSPGKVAVLNVWASWCIPCRAEHPMITALSVMDDTPIYGLNYKDTPDNANKFLVELGNPYDAVGADSDGRIGINLGVYGIPETYIIDGQGMIVHKHIGPLTETALETTFRPALEKAKNASKPDS